MVTLNFVVFHFTFLQILLLFFFSFIFFFALNFSNPRCSFLVCINGGREMGNTASNRWNENKILLKKKKKLFKEEGDS
jgi:hypothetical protein